MPTPTPRWYELAKKELGTREKPGSGNAPKVVQYYQDAVEQRQADSVPWCAAFIGSMLVRAGEASSGSLMARSYAHYGEKDNAPSPGTIVVFTRGKPPSGHVAFFDRDNGNGTIRVLGGNQSDAVTFTNYPKSRVLAYRWPIARPSKKAMRRGDQEMPKSTATAAVSMTYKEIMDKAKELYDSVDSTYSIGGTRKAAKTAASLMFYMAKNMLPIDEAKKVTKGPPAPTKNSSPKKPRARAK